MKIKFQSFDQRYLLAAKNSIVHIGMLVLLVIKKFIKKRQASLGNQRLIFNISNEVKYSSLSVRISKEQSAD